MSDQMHVQTAAAATSMANSLETEMRVALDRYAPGWTLEDVRRRCTTVRAPHITKAETFCMDGVALLEIYPLESEIERTADSYVVRWTRNVRHLFKGSQNAGEVKL